MAFKPKRRRRRWSFCKRFSRLRAVRSLDSSIGFWYFNTSFAPKVMSLAAYIIALSQEKSRATTMKSWITENHHVNLTDELILFVWLNWMSMLMAMITRDMEKRRTSSAVRVHQKGSNINSMRGRIEDSGKIVTMRNRSATHSPCLFLIPSFCCSTLLATCHPSLRLPLLLAGTLIIDGLKKWAIRSWRYVRRRRLWWWWWWWWWWYWWQSLKGVQSNLDEPRWWYRDRNHDGFCLLLFLLGYFIIIMRRRIITDSSSWFRPSFCNVKNRWWRWSLFYSIRSWKL